MKWRVERSEGAPGWFALHPSTLRGGWFATWAEALNFAQHEALLDAVCS